MLDDLPVDVSAVLILELAVRKPSDLAVVGIQRSTWETMVKSTPAVREKIDYRTV